MAHATGQQTEHKPEKLRTTVGVQGTHMVARVFSGVLSSLFFISALFAVFAPMPLMTTYLRDRKFGFAMTLALNTSIVGMFSGGASACIFFVLVGCTGFFLPYLLIERKASLELTVIGTLMAMGCGMAAAFVWGWAVNGTNPVNVVDTQVNEVMEQLKVIAGTQSPWGDELTAEEFKQRVWVELPSAVFIFAFVTVWLNLVLLVRLVSLGLKEQVKLSQEILKTWKAPEWLVWPTIVAGASIIFESYIEPQWIGIAGLNIFKCLMAVYAVQGLSVLSNLFDVWGVKGIWRSFLYGAFVFLMMPMLLALGFFDLWFDFRVKLGQRTE